LRDGDLFLAGECLDLERFFVDWRLWLLLEAERRLDVDPLLGDRRREVEERRARGDCARALEGLRAERERDRRARDADRFLEVPLAGERLHLFGAVRFVFERLRLRLRLRLRFLPRLRERLLLRAAAFLAFLALSKSDCSAFLAALSTDSKMLFILALASATRALELDNSAVADSNASRASWAAKSARR